jgi:uncharacterized membrane-anchored protein
MHRFSSRSLSPQIEYISSSQTPETNIMLKQLSCLSLAVAIVFIPNPSKAELVDRMPSNVRESIYGHVCDIYKDHRLTIKAMLEQSKNWYLSNANFESIDTNNLSTHELSNIKYEREKLAIQQASGLLRKAIDDDSCRPVSY